MSDRRAFIKGALAAAAALPMASRLSGEPTPATELTRVEAAYYDRLADKKISCTLCPNECRVADLERGTCGVRENQNGTYYTLVYGSPCSVHVDPIEKKPLFHYYPGSQAFSLGTAGCNFSCTFCQNWEVSQKRPEQVQAQRLLPADVVAEARRRNCRSIAHTYTEPVVFYEYVRECARLGKEQGVPNVAISNGFIQKKALREWCRYLDAIKIDLKAFNDTFYQRQCGGKLQPVLDTLLTLKEEKMWFEIVVLLIPTLNDERAEIERMTRWIGKELGFEVPLHFTRFYPTYMLRNLPPTPPETLMNARSIAMQNGLRYVYVGNWASDAENTYCPNCHKTIVSRVRFTAQAIGMQGNQCAYCRQTIPGLF